MSRAASRRGSRRARLETRRQTRQQRYGRFLGYTALGSLLPGAGLVAAGRRRIGFFLIFLFSMAVMGALAIVALVPTRRLLSYGGDRQMLFLVGGALATAAAVWLLVALISHRLLEPEGLPTAKRLGGALVVVVTTSLVVAPLTLAANNVFTQRDVIGAISGGVSHTTPEIEDHADPWADIPQLNVLLLGGDGGEGRDGIRPDTLILASIDTRTGDTTTVSLPRNLQSFPFPSDSPLSQIYPSGWLPPTGADQLEWMLNATWRNLPALHPEVFEGSDNPNADATKWAVEGALGIDIDYFVLVNLEGFQAIVDALGGVTLDVPRDIPVGNKEVNGVCTTPRKIIPAGADQHLNGSDALWFARSRCGSDDYDRMARQQCVINAIVDEIEPSKLITQYQSFASATRDMIETDVPEELFPALIDLMIEVQGGTMESLRLDRAFFRAMGTSSANPDYTALHAQIAEILTPAADEPGPDDTSQADPSESDAPADHTDPNDTQHEEAAGQGEKQPGGSTAPTEDVTSASTTDGGEQEDDADEPVDTEKLC